MSETIMVDCIGANVPVVKSSRFRNNPAQAYVTGGGLIEWTDPQILSFARHIRTCQSPVAFVDDISDAREQDVERWAATEADWPEFYNSRTDKSRAQCYASLTTVPKVLAACHEAGIVNPPRWRLAWWWKNAPGIPIPREVDVPAPTREEVLAELHRLTGITLAPQSLWACQFAHYTDWDLSVVYGVPDFARR